MASFYYREEELWFDNKMDYDIQLHQDNCLVFLNDEEPAKDKISVLDTRDDDWWAWYRFNTPDFDNILGHVVLIATVIKSPLPQQAVEQDYDNYLHSMVMDLDRGVPDEWIN